MTSESKWRKELLVRDLREFCKQGYRRGQARRLQKTPALIGLSAAGGPDLPTGPNEWLERREQLRALLKDVIENDLGENPPSPLDQRDIKAVLRLLRLDLDQPLDRNLQDVHSEIDRELFPDAGGEHFRKYRMNEALEAVADALLTREPEAQDRSSSQIDSAEDTGEEKARPRAGRSSTPNKRTTAKSPRKGKSASSSSKKAKPKARSAARQAKRTPQRQKNSDTPATSRPSRKKTPKKLPIPPQPAGSTVPSANSQGERSPRAVRRAVAAFLGALAVGLTVVAAMQLRDRGGSGDPAVAVSPQERSPAKAQPPTESSSPAAPLIDFSVHVKKWCYCGDSDSHEAQVKIKPRLVNHSSRVVDLRTGPNARLVLALYAPSTRQRDWLSPTRPRYRRFGNWLLVPPNAPEQLVSNTSFESHWDRRFLGPFESFFRRRRHKGDLVFNVPNDLSIPAASVRLAYRPRRGPLYFPPGSGSWEWRGYGDGYYF